MQPVNLQKACPLVLRDGAAGRSVLAFRHPLAGTQIVKGTVEQGEAPGDAARRELLEESGLRAAQVSAITQIDQFWDAQDWFFFLCKVEKLPPQGWVHHAPDDGGLEFRFFWHPLAARPDTSWHRAYQKVLTDVVPLIP